MRLKAGTMSIKTTIITSVILLCMFFALLISTIFYWNFKNLLTNYMAQVTIANLRILTNTIDESFRQIETVMYWSTTSSSLPQILSEPERDAGYDREMITFVQDLKSMISGVSAEQYIQKLLVGDDDGNIGVQIGSIPGDPRDGAACLNSGWLRPMLQDPELVWSGPVSNPFRYASDRFILSIARPVVSHSNGKTEGWIMIGVDSGIVSQRISRYTSYEDSTVFVLNQSGQVLYHRDGTLIGTSPPEYAELPAKFRNTAEGFLNVRLKAGDTPLVYCRMPTSGWYIVQTLSPTQLREQQKMFIGLLITVGGIILLVGVLLSVFLGSHITKPIGRINRKIKRISLGDFAAEPGIESDDEVGYIGKGINQMAGNIATLMRQAVANEKVKKNLELQALQSQINPHFLYNTLNSIKWMAKIQKATGIGEMSTALARLLQNLAKSPSQKIPLCEELELVKDYILIQQYRYGDSFRIRYEVAPECGRCKIVKFTLQPLVENAIFHGIEPKGGQGEIVIRIFPCDEGLCVIVRDNGVGMDAEKIGAVLSGESSHASRGLSSIGIYNVSQRLVLTYGPASGIRIESAVGEYTEISFVIPREEQEADA